MHSVLRFWPVEELAQLAGGPTGCGEVARGGCLFAWNLESDVVNCTYEGGEKEQTTHDAIAVLVTRSEPTV